MGGARPRVSSGGLVEMMMIRVDLEFYGGTVDSVISVRSPLSPLQESSACGSEINSKVVSLLVQSHARAKQVHREERDYEQLRNW